MAVISEYELNGVIKTKNDDGTLISSIEINKKQYNFANRNNFNGTKTLFLDNVVKEPIYDMQVYGNSIQDGTPTPENPIEIESVGDYDETTGKYKIPIKVSDGVEEYTTDIYLDEPLRKIGDYADYIDYKNKKVVRYIDKYIFKGTESLSFRGQQPANGTAVFTAVMLSYRENFENLICTRLSADRNYASNMTPNTCCFINSSVDSRFHFCLEGAGKTVNEVQAILKEWYDSGNPMVVYYPPNKAIPEETIEIPTIETFKGTNVFSIDTKTDASQTNIECWRQIGAEKETYYNITFNDGVFVLKDNISIGNNTKVPVGTSLVVGYTLTDGYKLTSFTVNGVETENNSTITVTGDIEIVFAEEEESSGSAIYGVSWTNDASTTMTRTDDAVNMTYSIDASTGKVTSDFNNVFPYNQMKRHVINGNTFVYVPEMWFRVVADSDQKITSLAVSKVKGDGDNWYKTRPFYYGAYGASSDGTVLKSVSSATMISSLTKIQARQRAVSVGAGYHLKDLYSLTILMFLWWIEFGTKNWRDVFSFNTTNTKTGNTDSFYNETIGDGLFVTGYNTSTKNFVWHGIEDFFGAHTEHIDGVTGNQVNNGTIYASDNYSIYDYYNNGSQMPALSYTFTTTNTNYSCVKSYGWDKNNPFLCLPIETLYDNNSKSGFCIFRFEGNDQDWAFGIYTTGYSNVTAFYESFSNTISGTTLGERLVLNA